MGDPEAIAQLAAAVLRQAWLDAHQPMLPVSTRAGARAFLVRPSALREFWCAAAGLEPTRVGAWAARNLGPSGPGEARGGHPQDHPSLVPLGFGDAASGGDDDGEGDPGAGDQAPGAPASQGPGGWIKSLAP